MSCISASMSEPGAAAWVEVRRPSPALEDCEFYHSVDLPTGPVRGQWDLRAKADAYLGGVAFAGKSVLEIGPASGFLSFHMERSGASVTAVEPSMRRLWDAAPMPGYDLEGWRTEHARHIAGVRNSFWYLHHLYGSKARLFEADAEHIPAEAGDFDVGVLASVLLHCREPLAIMEGTARRVRETMVVTDVHDPALGELPVCRLLPGADAPERQVHTWWTFSSSFIVNALGLLGFTRAQVTVQDYPYESIGRDLPMFTVVARRP